MPTTGADRPRRSDEARAGGGRIETARLCLRRPGAQDIPDLVRHAGLAEVAEMTAQIPHPYTEAHARTWLAAIEAWRWVRAICLRDDDSFAGVVSITPAAPDDPWELGFWLAKPHWGQGYMTEAARGLLRAYFEATEASAVQSSAFVGNAASLRVQDKLNFRRVGEINVYSPVRGQSRDLIVTELARSEFRP